MKEENIYNYCHIAGRIESAKPPVRTFKTK